ncbi:MAG: T9SS type A sorting domain-containing protein [Candidatus Eisenbacteria bacterium]
MLSTLFFLPSSGDAADGFPVCDVAGDQESPSLARASDLATWIAWRDGRRTDATVRTDLYAARLPALVAADASLAAASAPAFAPLADGVAVCLSGTAGPPVAVATDSGGVLVVWGDSRVPRGIYLQRLRADGGRYPGWPVDGRLITADVEDLTLVACSDGAGGAYVGRKPAPTLPGMQSIRLTRITKLGTFAPGWSEPGVSLGGDELVQGVTLAADPAGGAVFTIRLYFNGGAADPQYGRAGRISPTGALSPNPNLPGWRSGGISPGIVGSLAIADGGGGLFAAWNDAPGPHFYGQHWNAAGAAQWPDSLPAPHMDALVGDGTGGVYLVGREKQDLNRLSVQRRTAAGAVSAGWEPGGRLLAEPLALAHDGAIPVGDGILAYWSDKRGTSSGFDIRATHVRANGRLGAGWVGGGDAICDVPGDQTNVTGVAGSIVLAWVDARNLATTRKDLFAKYVLGPEGGVDVAPTPLPPWRLGFRSVFPNPARDELKLTLNVPGDEPLVLEVIDLRGRVVRRRTLAPDGPSVTVLVPARDLPSGLYWLRAIQGDRTARARAIVLH